MTAHTQFLARLLRLAPAALLACAVSSQTVWLPAPGQVEVTPDYTFQTFQGYQRGAKPTKLSSSLTQQTGLVNVDVGISAVLAADATLGYSHTSSLAYGGPKSDAGMTDSLVGLRYRFLPVLALRVGAVIQGTYTGISLSRQVTALRVSKPRCSSGRRLANRAPALMVTSAIAAGTTAPRMGCSVRREFTRMWAGSP